MTDSNYSNYRPEVDLAADKIDEYLKELEDRNAQQQAVEQEATEKEDQALAQQLVFELQTHAHPQDFRAATVLRIIPVLPCAARDGLRTRL